MEENNIKTTLAKNLNKLTFNSAINIPVDANVNIKTILNVCSYIYDKKVECSSGKAIFSGRIGLKVLYLDTDNITNTIADSSSFSETITDDAITNNCTILFCNENIVNNILDYSSALKINCEVTINPTMYLTLPVSNNSSKFENMIVKKAEVQTCSISGVVKTNFDYTTNFETKDNILKVLYYNANFCLENLKPQDDYVTVEGKMHCTMLYETSANDETVIKEITDTFNVATDVEIKNISKDSLVDLTCSIDKSKETLTTEIDDGNSVVTVVNSMSLTGVILQNLTLDVVDDMYSTENELELTKSEREFTKNAQTYFLQENLTGEISLASDEPAIDDVVANLDMTALVTNAYIKDEILFVEGVITSNLIYVDETQNYTKKPTEIPFIVNTKINMENLNAMNCNVSIMDCKVKTKRGTIVELEYVACLEICVYEKAVVEMVDNVNLGASLNFANYDYQIFLTHPGETMWELCKRIKISPDDITQYNKNLPLIMEGGEKVIIKR